MAKRRWAAPDQNRCVACGVCVKVCPKGAIQIYKGCFAYVDKKCISCGLCENHCIGCGLCAKACPAGCIELKEGEV